MTQENLRLTLEDLETGRKYGCVGDKNSPVGAWEEAVRVRILDLQGSSFLSVPVPVLIDE